MDVKLVNMLKIFACLFNYDAACDNLVQFLSVGLNDLYLIGIGTDFSRFILSGSYNNNNKMSHFKEKLRSDIVSVDRNAGCVDQSVDRLEVAINITNMLGFDHAVFVLLALGFR